MSARQCGTEGCIRSPHPDRPSDHLVASDLLPARRPRPVVLRRLVVTIPESTCGLLEKLRATGLFGLTVEDVAERLICKHLEENYVVRPRLKLPGAKR